jgi:thiamine kinase-like enzyme
VEDLVTHNDMKPDNVVFRDGRAVALIDFDLASPGSRAWDVACAARLWAPLRPRIHISDVRRGREFERFRLFVDSYGMNDSDRVKVAEGVQQNYKWFYDLIKSSAASGHPGFTKLWTSKTSVRAELTTQWYAENERNLRAALGI